VLKTAKPLFRCALLGVVASAVVLGQSVYSAPLRVPPTRAATTNSVIRLGGVEYVSVYELARRWGLHSTWLKKDDTLLLKNERWKIELNADSREAQINGLRILLGEPCRIERRTIYLSKIDAERVIGPVLRPGYLQPSVPDLRVIAIDPGHGGVDNGTQNIRLGLQEKKLTLDVAMRLGRLLRAEGYKVVFTRETDTKIELPLRAAKANALGADLFISIHFNSLPKDSKTHGTELFTFAPAEIRSTDSWSTKVSDVEKEPSPVNKYDHWSAILAFAMHHGLISSLKTFDRGQKLAHFGVLRSLNCPGVLLEAGFLSNETEARKIDTPEYRQQIAESMAHGVRSYAATLASVRPAPAKSAAAGN